MKKNNFKIIELKSSKEKSTIKRTVFIKDLIIEEIEMSDHQFEKYNKARKYYIF